MARQLLHTGCNAKCVFSFQGWERLPQLVFLFCTPGRFEGSPTTGLPLPFVLVGGWETELRWRAGRDVVIGGFDSLPVISPTRGADLATFKPRAQVECARNGLSA